MSMTGRPQWWDAKAVAEWILEMRYVSILRAMGFKKGPDDDTWIHPNPIFTTSEQQAIDAANRGKPQELADMIEAEVNLLEADPDHTLKLTPATLRAVAEFLSGKRKRQRGRPKMSKLERTNRTPTHEAAMMYFPAVRQVLREEYPDQTAKDYRERALDIVERVCGVKGETVTKYRSDSKSSKRRV
jgi:hypothetical protein